MTTEERLAQQTALAEQQSQLRMVAENERDAAIRMTKILVGRIRRTEDYLAQFGSHDRHCAREARLIANCDCGWVRAWNEVMAEPLLPAGDGS